MIDENDEQIGQVEALLEETSDLLEETKNQLDEVKQKVLLGPMIEDYRGDTKKLVALVKEALKAGSDANDDSRNDHRPLQLAIRKGYTEVAFLLIEFGADINYRDKSWLDPIHTAINYDQFEVAKLLIKKGVDFNRFNPDLSYKYGNWYRFCFGG